MTSVNYKLNYDISKFEKYVKDYSEAYAQVGVLGKQKSKNGVTVSDYAIVHEFGSINHNIPRRSFIKDPLEKHLSNEIRTIEGTLKQLLTNGDVKKAVAVLGMKAVEVIKKAFKTSNDGQWAPLAESTIENMKYSDPNRYKGWKILVDTGALESSITSKVIVTKGK